MAGAGPKVGGPPAAEPAAHAAATSSSSTSLPGPIGRYRPLKLLGRGGMAEVYLAQASGPQGFSRQVALKLVLPEQIERPEVVRMFLEEARVAAQFTHPNIVQVYDFGEVDGRYFIAMEYCNGLSLRLLGRKLKSKNARVPDAIAAAIGSQICAGLAYAHSRTGPDGTPMKLVHRDVTPENILLSVEGAAKVADFGIAKSTLRTGEETLAGMVKGKPAYMSPEQCAGHELDGRSDVFSLGATLWEALASERLYEGNDLVAVVTRVATELPREVHGVVADVNPELADVVMAALEREVSQRPTAADLQRSFDTLLHRMGVANSQTAIAAFLRGDLKPTLLARATGPNLPGLSAGGPPPMRPSRTPSSNPNWVMSRLEQLEQVAHLSPSPAASSNPTGARGPSISNPGTRGPSASNPGPRGPSSSNPGASRGPSTSEPRLEPVSAAAPAGPPPAGSDAPLELAIPARPDLERPGRGPQDSWPPGTPRRAERTPDRPRPATTPPRSTNSLGRAAPRAPERRGRGGRSVAIIAGMLAAAAVAGGLLWPSPSPQPAPEEPRPSPRVAVRFESEPAGASIDVDGKPTGRQTPDEVEVLNVTNHDFSFSLPGYESVVGQFQLPLEGTVFARLSPLLTLRVRSEPSGARVRLDTRVVGETPCQFAVGSGRHRFTVEKDGYLPATLERAVTADWPEWSVAMVPAAYLRVRSNPPGAQIFVDGQNLNLRSPAERVPVSANEVHEVVLRLGHLSSEVQKVKRLAPGKTEALEFSIVDRDREQREARRAQIGARLKALRAEKRAVDAQLDKLERGDRFSVFGTEQANRALQYKRRLQAIEEEILALQDED